MSNSAPSKLTVFCPRCGERVQQAIHSQLTELIGNRLHTRISVNSTRHDCEGA